MVWASETLGSPPFLTNSSNTAITSLFHHWPAFSTSLSCLFKRLHYEVYICLYLYYLLSKFRITCAQIYFFFHIYKPVSLVLLSFFLVVGNWYICSSSFNRWLWYRVNYELERPKCITQPNRLGFRYIIICRNLVCLRKAPNIIGTSSWSGLGNG